MKEILRLLKLENFVWSIRKRLSWYIYGFKKIDENKIVISSFNGKGYFDNPKYIIESLIKKRSGLDIVCLLTKARMEVKEELPDYIRVVECNTKDEVYELATAKVWIDNVRKTDFVRKRKKQIYIQTWHGGIAPKLIEKDAEHKLSKKYIDAAKRDSKNIDVVISDSGWQTKFYQRSFWYNGEIMEVGLPRNDIYFNKEVFEKIDSKYREKLNLAKDVKVILYAPTFRENNDVKTYSLEFDKIIEEFENKFGGRWKILVKLHPNIAGFSKELHFSENVIDATHIDDTQELEIFTDVLITDYSSMSVDYILMKKFAFTIARDYEEYEKERGFAFSPKELPYPLAFTDKELLDNIKNFDEKLQVDGINKFINDYKPVMTGTAAAAISNWLIERMD